MLIMMSCFLTKDGLDYAESCLKNKVIFGCWCFFNLSSVRLSIRALFFSVDLVCKPNCLEFLRRPQLVFATLIPKLDFSEHPYDTHHYFAMCFAYTVFPLQINTHI